MATLGAVEPPGDLLEDVDLLSLLTKYFPSYVEASGMQQADWRCLPADVFNLVLDKSDKAALSSLRGSCATFKRAVDAWVVAVELR
jgi:hypothetical protein